MREDGAVVDKIVLTKSDSYTPSGLGPEPSPRQSSAAPVDCDDSLPPGTASVRISWTPPEYRNDGSDLSEDEIDYYEVHYRRSDCPETDPAYAYTVQALDGETSALLDHLPASTSFDAAVKVWDRDGMESEYSDQVEFSTP
jgi:hypothetical protein